MSETTQTDRSYDAAMYVVLAYQRASVSLVQRYLRVGYQRAVHLLQELERRGVVGPLPEKGERPIYIEDDHVVKVLEDQLKTDPQFAKLVGKLADKFKKWVPRDPARIPVVLEEIRKIWVNKPDLRLGQIIEIASLKGPSIFYIEDEELVKGLSRLKEDVLWVQDE